MKCYWLNSVVCVLSITCSLVATSAFADHGGHGGRNFGGVGDNAVGAQHLVACPATHSLVGCVDVNDSELGIAQHERVCGGVENGAILLFARAYRLLGSPPLGDIARDPQDVRRTAMLERDHPHF